jgi:hypothetical protein
MGSSTFFLGGIAIDPPLSDAEDFYLYRFARTRRMLRKSGPYSKGKGSDGEADHEDTISYNTPAMGQPSLWCQWIPNEDGTALVWDGNRSFHNSDEWMLYLIQHFLAPDAIAIGQVPGIVGGHVLNGTIQVHGEDADHWLLIVENNEVYTKEGRRKHRVVPHDYLLPLISPGTRAYFAGLFKVAPPDYGPQVHLVAQITPDPETGRPSPYLNIHEWQDSRVLLSYFIGPDGKAARTGTLEWQPPEET